MATLALTGVLADVDQTTPADAAHPADVFVLELHDRFVKVVVPASALAIGPSTAFVGACVRVYCSSRSAGNVGAGLQWVADLAVPLITRH